MNNVFSNSFFATEKSTAMPSLDSNSSQNQADLEAGASAGPAAEATPEAGATKGRWWVAKWLTSAATPLRASFKARSARAEFESAIAAVKAEFDEMEVALPVLIRHLSDARCKVRAEDAKALREAVEREAVRLVGACGQIKNKLKAVQQKNQDNLEVPGCEEGTCDARHRASVTLHMVNKLKDMVEQVRELRAQAQRDSREAVQRRMAVVTGRKPSEEEVDAVVATGNAEDVLRLAVEVVGRQGETAQLQAALEEISERKGAVEKVTRELLELQAMIFDMAAVVSSHNDLIHSIENHVNKAVEDTHVSVDALTNAERRRRETRKWRCIGLLVLVAVLLIIFLPIIITIIT